MEIFKFSQEAESILTFLNNIEELIVQSNNRKDAAKVLRSLQAFIKDNKYPLPELESDIKNLLRVLIDSRPYTISSMLHDMGRDVIQLEHKQHRLKKMKKPNKPNNV